MQVPIQIIVTLDQDDWARVSGCRPQDVAGNVAAYIESELLELDLIREAPVRNLVAKAADVHP